LVEAHRLLTEFQNNPFYSFFTKELQIKADSAMVSIIAGFQNPRDILSLVEREQVIGAAPIYLSFAQLSEGLKEDLQLALLAQQ
jgi:hypothetical protein